MSVEIYFNNLDLETKLDVLNENRIEYFSFKEFNGSRATYNKYLDDVGDSELNAGICPLAIYEIDPSVFEDE